MAGNPTVASSLVDRVHLRRQLDDCLLYRLSAIIAQAGSGKSTLIDQWVASHPEVPVVRLNVVAADVDSSSFAQHLVRQLDGVRTVTAVASARSASAAGLGSAFIQSIADNLAGPTVVIAIDDLHLLDGTPLLADVGSLVDACPDNVHFIIASRMDLSIASRRRLAGMVEIRQSDLALGLAESADLLERASGFRLTDEHAALVYDKTEGWVAGLQLAGLTLRRHADPAEFVESFNGSDRLVADYLGEEVLASLPTDRRASFLRMAMLDRLSVEVVLHLWGDGDEILALDQLKRNGIFVVSLDERGDEVRFHHLFQDLLRYRFRSEDPIGAQQTLILAAEWHLDNDDVDQAVEYLLRARAWDRAIAVIVGSGAAVFEQGHYATVLDWITRIPEAQREKSVHAQLMLGTLLGMSARTAESDDILRRITVRADSTSGERACALALMAVFTQWRPRADMSIEMARSALRAIEANGEDPIPDIFHLTDAKSIETIALVSGGRAHFLLGQIEEARDWLRRSLTSAGAEYSLWRISALGSLGVLEAWVGNLRVAEQLATEALAIAEQVGSLGHPSIAEAHLTLALVRHCRGDITGAHESFSIGLARTTMNGRAELLWVCVCIAVLIGEDQGILDRPTTPASPVVTARLNQEASHRQRAVGLPDELTGRELQILSYMPSRLSKNEIAELSFVSVNTVKTHMAHIYRKLDVTDRDAAVARAQELGLLTGG